MSREERIQAQENFRRSLAYRTENYGHFEGFGDPRLNDHSPQHYAERTEVFGLPVRLNRRIIPAGHDGHAGALRIMGRRHVQRVDVVATATEHPRHAGKHAKRIFHQN